MTGGEQRGFSGICNSNALDAASQLSGDFCVRARFACWSSLGVFLCLVAWVTLWRTSLDAEKILPAEIGGGSGK